LNVFIVAISIPENGRPVAEPALDLVPAVLCVRAVHNDSRLRAELTSVNFGARIERLRSTRQHAREIRDLVLHGVELIGDDRAGCARMGLTVDKVALLVGVTKP
jgi:hypothetical protein